MKEGEKPFELAALVVRVYRSLSAITSGDERVMRAWVRSENTALGMVPVEMMKHVTGLVDVVTYLDSRRAPV